MARARVGRAWIAVSCILCGVGCGEAWQETDVLEQLPAWIRTEVAPAHGEGILFLVSEQSLLNCRNLGRDLRHEPDRGRATVMAPQDDSAALARYLAVERVRIPIVWLRDEAQQQDLSELVFPLRLVLTHGEVSGWRVVR